MRLVPSIANTKNTIAKTTTNTNFNSGNNADAPNVIIVVQMNANTSSGANFKILLIIQNTASSDPLKNSLTGSAFLPTAANHNPKNTAKKIIGNNSPLFKASKKLSEWYNGINKMISICRLFCCMCRLIESRNITFR